MPINYKEYPSNWRSEIVPRIRARAGDCCEKCGIKNKLLGRRQKDGSFEEADMYDITALEENGGNNQVNRKILGLTQIILTVAHLDHDHTNLAITDDRLQALCQKCHLQLDMPKHVANRKYGRGHSKQPTLF